jgi:hypothetical protein
LGLSILSAFLAALVVTVAASFLCPVPFVRFWVIPITGYAFLGGLLLVGAGFIQTILRRWNAARDESFRKALAAN